MQHPPEAQRFGRGWLDGWAGASPVSAGAVDPLARELRALVHTSVANNSRELILHMV